MEPKIFLLIATFLIAEVKSNKALTQTLLGIEDIIEIDKKLHNFTDAVLLTELTLCEIPNFSKCRKSNWKNEYEETINGFYVSTTSASDTMTDELSKIFKYKDQTVNKHVNELGQLLQKYKDEFVKHADANPQGLKTLTAENKFKIEEKFKNLYFELFGIKKKTNQSSHKDKVTEFENKLEKEMNILKKDCNKIVNKIKECSSKI